MCAGSERWAAPPARRQYRATFIALAVAGLATAVVGVVFALIPLPTQNVSLLGGTGGAWCGPGSTSESALVVRLDPNSVNSGDTGDTTNITPAQIATAKRQFKSYCVGIADTRLTLAGVLLGVGAVLALAMVVALYRIDWRPSPVR